MQRNKALDTAPEKRLRSILWQMGFRFRIGHRLLGKPDIVFSRQKVVVFVDGCFWHGCREHWRLPKSNSVYWSRKIDRNRMRDLKTSRELRKQGWRVIRVWEHETIPDIEKPAMAISSVLKKSSLCPAR
jgi:DNA mismatch endonuclease (patch repair protein)